MSSNRKRLKRIYPVVFLAFFAGAVGLFLFAKFVDKQLIPNRATQTSQTTVPSLPAAIADTDSPDAKSPARVVPPAPPANDLEDLIPALSSPAARNGLTGLYLLHDGEAKEQAARMESAHKSQDPLIRCRLSLLEGDLSAAIASARNLVEDSGTSVARAASAMYVEAVSLVLMGQKTLGLDSLTVAAALADPQKARQEWLLLESDAAALELDLGLSSRASARLERVLAVLLIDTDPAALEIARVRTILGDALLAQDRLAEALIHLQAAAFVHDRSNITATPAWVDCRALLHRVFSLQKSYANSEKTFVETKLAIENLPVGEARNAAFQAFAKHLVRAGFPEVAEPMFVAVLAARREASSEPSASTLVRSSVFDLFGCRLAAKKSDDSKVLSDEILALPTPSGLPEARAFLAQLQETADLLRKNSLRSEAVPYLARIIVIRDKFFPREADALLTSLHDYGKVLAEIGNVQVARAVFTRALELLTPQLGRKQELLASVCVQLGVLCLSEKDGSEKAAAYFNRAIAAAGSDSLARSPILVPAYDFFAGRKEAAGELPAAEDFQRKSLDIRQRELDENHPSLAIRYNNLGAIRQKQKDLPGAETFYRKAIFIAEQTAPIPDDKRDIYLANLISLCQETGKTDDAEKFSMRLIAIKSSELGENGPEIAKLYNNLAMWMEKQGRDDRAIPLYRQAVLLCYKYRKETKKTSPHQKTCVANYSGILKSKGASVPELEAELNGLLRMAGLL